MQTLEIARRTDGAIVGLDVNPAFLTQLEEAAHRAQVAGRIQTVRQSMLTMDFPPASFDLIWAEGSIYIIGFAEGLRQWRSLLTSGGYLAVTHVTWLTRSIPEEAATFWDREYPAITTIDRNLEIARATGYEEVGHFALPASAWWDDYYTPMEARLKLLREEYRGDDPALAILRESQEEIELYQRHSAAYGYVFYILQRRD